MTEEEPGANDGKRDVIIVLSGLEGSGKSTLGRKLSEMLGWPLVSTGEFLSTHADDRDGKLQAGHRLDQKTSGRWVTEMLPPGQCVVDSVRSVKQLEALRAERRVQHVNVVCSREKRLQRLKDRGRDTVPIPAWDADSLARYADDSIDTGEFDPGILADRIMIKIGENLW